MPAFVERVDREDRGGGSDQVSRKPGPMDAVKGKKTHKTETGGAPADRRRPGAVEPTTTLMGYGPMRGDAGGADGGVVRGRRGKRRGGRRRTAAMTQDEIRAHLRDLSALRTNRRHKLHRAYENAEYRFEVVCDYGAFRDLQRHRMLTIDWQELGTDLGYVLPEGRRTSRAGRGVQADVRRVPGGFGKDGGGDRDDRGAVRLPDDVGDPVHDEDERAGSVPHARTPDRPERASGLPEDVL